MIRKCEKRIFSENRAEIRLIYSIIENMIEEDKNSYLSYGIKVEKYMGECMTEYSEIPNITLKTIEIQRLFMLLSEHTVTPMCLKEVVEDYLADVFCGG